MIGCSGGCIAHELTHRWPQMDLTVIDRDDDAIRLGRYLCNGSSKVAWITEDARTFFKSIREQNKYDIIINDAFDIEKGSMPSWTLSRDFLRDATSCLVDHGRYIQNVLYENPNDLFVHNRRLCSRFADVRLIPAGLSIFENIIFECSHPHAAHLFTAK